MTVFEQEASMAREEHDHDSYAKRVNIVGGSISATVGSISLYPSAAHIGSVSIFGTVQSSSGNVTLNVGPNSIGLVTLNPSNANIGSVSVLGGTINSLVSLNPSSNFIGLVTTVPTYISGYTLINTVISATGPATIVVPPTGQKIFLKNLHVSSLGRSEISFWKANGSATVSLLPWTSLATTGGYVDFFGDNGSEWGVANDAMTAALNGAATVGVGVNVRFGA